MQESHKRVQWVYESTSNRELEERYDVWASEYDRDLTKEFAWIAPQKAVALLQKYVSPSAAILDAGAGTGLVGECLVNAGYYNLVAMDMSQKMLEQAKRKILYRDHHRMVLGKPLAFASNQFDAVISVGVFTRGHAPASSFDELIRITKSNGFIVFSLRIETYEYDGFKEHQLWLEKTKRWELASVSEQFRPMPKGEPGVLHQIWSYRVI
jgi:ubiquinone/menaquinone biosynthesis C-methylase UbiE